MTRNTHKDNHYSYASARRQSILKQSKQIVIIDDQSTGRTILKTVLEKIADNINVIAFGDSSAALDWIKNNHPDLIVTDYRMPHLNGIDLTRQIRLLEHCISVPIVMITVVSEKKVRYDALDTGVTAFLNRPIDQIECRTTCRNLLQMHEQHLIIQDRAEWLARQVQLATKQIVAREKETIIRLAKAGEYRDQDTGNHVIRMAKYSKLIAEAHGVLTRDECEELEYAAPMHDIGKIGIPDNILLKPGKFDKEEWAIMQTHSRIGHSILTDSQSRYMQTGAIIALNHHERFDGLGYPNGLKGTEIPLIARIVAVADVFDALVSTRPYKAAWSIEAAVDHIHQHSGTHFDPDCVDAFSRCLVEIRQIHLDYSDD